MRRKNNVTLYNVYALGPRSRRQSYIDLGSEWQGERLAIPRLVQGGIDAKAAKVLRHRIQQLGEDVLILPISR